MQNSWKIFLFIFFFAGRIVPAMSQEISYEEVLRVTSKVNNENRFTGSLDANTLHQLPIGIIKEIGAARYIIAIDSAVFLPEGAYFHAYMAIEFPGTDKKIAFAARSLRFNPQGVVGGNQSRLMLVSEHRFSLSPQLGVVLPSDGSNFVEWDCNGFNAIQLKGDFLFSSSLFIPAEPDTSGKVKASFSILTTDIHQFITRVSISPFKIKGLADWSFEVHDAIVDQSSVANPSGIIFPFGYVNDGGNLWTGFWLKEIKITLPSEFSKRETRTTIFSHNLLIDDTGISGVFGATNILSLNEGDMSGWNFSLDELSVQLVENKFSGGNLRGKIHLPVMDTGQGLIFDALISYNEENKECDYSFNFQSAENIDFKAFGAQVDVFPTSYLQVSRNNGKFFPEAELNGRIAFHHDDFETAKLQFQQLHLVTSTPYITNGVFAFSGSGDSKLSNFPVSIDSVFLRYTNQNVGIGFKVAVNFMENQQQGFSASSIVVVETKNENNKLHFDKLNIGAMHLNVNSLAFKLNGTIHFRKDDPVYGNGFAGNIQCSIPGVLESGFSAGACFGSLSYKYFAVDAFVPVQIPLGSSPVALNRLMGGLYYHMRPQKSSSPQYTSSLYTDPAPGMTQIYSPDQSIGLGFKAGVSFKYIPNEKTVNGDVMLDLAFSSSGGMEYVRLGGNAFFMSTISERRQKPAALRGTVTIQYDFPSSTFDADAAVTVNVQPLLQGSASAKIHIDPQIWYVCIGRPSQPGSVQIQNFANAQAYVMAGKNLEPMLPPPSQLNDLVNASGMYGNRNQSSLENASGFAAGMRFNGGMYKEFGWDFFSVYGSFAYGAGFDLMLMNHGSSAHCSNQNTNVGFNGWTAEGQIYAYLQGTIGVKGTVSDHDFDITVLSGSVAAMLTGRLPNPAYVYGGITCSYSILSIINGSFHFDFEAGENCTIVQ